MATPDISIIIPAHNEEQSLPELLSEVDKVIKKSKLKVEYIIVDDNSTDNTFKVAQQLGKKFPVRPIKKGLPRGIGTGIRVGIANARAKVGIVVMADNVDPFQCIPTFYDRITKDGYKLAVCSRYKTKENSRNIPPIYQFWSKMYRRFSRLFLGIPLEDLTNAYRAFDIDFVRKLNLTSNGFEISAETTFKVWFASKKVCEVEGMHRKRKKGESTFSFRKFGFAYFRMFTRAVLRRILGRWYF